VLQQQNAEQHRSAYNNLSQEQLSLRQVQDAEQHGTARAALNDQQRQQLQQQNAEQHRTAYANLSPEQRSLRRVQDSEQHRAAYANLSPEQRTLRQVQDAEQHRTAYANLSPEQRTLRQEQDAEQHRIAYANLNPEQRVHRQQNIQSRRNVRNEQPRLHLAATVPITNEASVPQNSIGSRNNICSHCGALRWPLEGTRGTLCCSNGKNGNLSQIFQSQFPLLLHVVHMGHHKQSGFSNRTKPNYHSKF